MKKSYSEIARNGEVVEVEFDKEHAIFAAHMPGMPICPGALLVQMAQELLGKEVREVKNVKFLQLLDPIAQPRVCFRLLPKTDTQIQVEVFSAETLYAKMTLCIA